LEVLTYGRSPRRFEKVREGFEERLKILLLLEYIITLRAINACYNDVLEVKKLPLSSLLKSGIAERYNIYISLFIFAG
jgi:hypothetical protein